MNESLIVGIQSLFMISRGFVIFNYYLGFTSWDFVSRVLVTWSLEFSHFRYNLSVSSQLVLSVLVEQIEKPISV
jgi:hypothetical protein